MSTAPTTPTRPEPLPKAVAAQVPMLVMIVLMWVGEIVDTAAGGRLDRFGIRPRRVDGLDGIVFAPFLHGGFGHLIANTVPFVVLGAIIAIGGAGRFLLVTLVVAVIGGVGTWLTGGSNTLVIGASGLVFGYLLYLLSRGIFGRHLGHILLALVVFALYGGVLWGLLPRPGVSWQGHLFGGVGGVAAASLIHRSRRDDGDAPPSSKRAYFNQAGRRDS